MKKTLIVPIFSSILLLCSQINASAAQSRAEFEKTGKVVWEADTSEKLVALTFDDGPHPVFTPQILDLLAKYHAKATFFVTGSKAEQFPEILKREEKEGHEIANHTFHHISYQQLSSKKLSNEIVQTDKTIKQIIGYKPSLFRSVGGHYDPWIVNTAEKNGKLVVIWTWGQDSRDWSNPPVSKICNTITSGAKPGSIILFHDWHGFEDSKSCKTVEALETILEFLQKNGYNCVTVTELLYRSSQIIPDNFNIYPAKRNKIMLIPG